ncbi:thioesterase family protein [Leptolyngbya sp. FACHB-261]|uniref:acyl-CoA thioesterase n=1 Tax=Leptolyngbya sp. FACHB-261 TaxID=2692806 RepID=UPI001685430D|nr:thioesterase family protein [Leptolyngbya sp. FACHB-261]MBD2099378.1 acyl-CoA thioesterase [Leptolyngbya sp. FACHB-261]
MIFHHPRTVRFEDTDAAGVVYFANFLKMCHEAYEESLAASGIDLKLFFRSGPTAIPIVHASVDFLKPIFCGDQLTIALTAEQFSGDTFTITYAISTGLPESAVGKALTRHICIDPGSRTRKALPEEIKHWLNPSS